MLRNLSLAAVALILPALAACSETTGGSSSAANSASKSVDASPITGNWCNASGQRISISRERFDSNEAQCSITRLNNYQGTFTAALSCIANGQQTNENITITPVGQKLLISYLSKGVKRDEVTRCGG